MNKLTRKEIGLLLTLAFVQFTHILDAMIMMPMAPNFKRTMHIDSQHFGILVSSYGFAAFVSAITATFWADRFDRKKVLLFLYAGFLVGTSACALASDFHSLIASRIFTGLFGGVAGAIILSIIGDVIPLEKRARGMGMLMMGFSLASIAGVPAGIYFSEHYNWHVPFYMIVAIGVPVFFLIFLTIPSITIHLQNTAPRQNLYRIVFSDMNQVRALIFSMFVVFAHFSIVPYISDFMVNNNKFSMKDELFWMYIIGGILTVFASPFIGKLADRHGRFRIFAIINVLAMLPLYLIPHFHSHSFWAMIGVAATFFIFSGGRMVPSSAIITSAVEPRYRGGFMSLNSAVQQLSVAACTIIGGTIITNNGQGELFHYETVGYIGMAFSILVLFVGMGVTAVNQK